MDRSSSSLRILGRDIAFRSGADMERAKIAAELIEQMYEEQKQKARGAQSKDVLLTFLALGLADKLLQLKTRQAELETRIEALLAKIEKSV